MTRSNKHTVRLTVTDMKNILNALTFQRNEWRGPADTWPADMTMYRMEDILDDVLRAFPEDE